MVGLKFNKEESGIIAREETSDEILEVKAMELKEMALESVREGGHSNKMLKTFPKWMNHVC